MSDSCADRDARRARGPGRRFIRGLRTLAATLLAMFGASVAMAGPSVGDPAPPFTLSGSDGRSYSLQDLLAEHEGVVLAWFPKAFTPG
jgi:hypothetical protein